MKTRTIIFAAALAATVACTKEKAEGPLVPLSLDVNVEFEGDENGKLGLSGKAFAFENSDKIGLTQFVSGKKASEFTFDSASDCFSGVVDSNYEGEFAVSYPYSKNTYMKSDFRVFDVPFAIFQLGIKDGLPEIAAPHYDDTAVGKKIALLYGETVKTEEGKRKVNLKARNAYLKITFGTSNIKEVYINQSSGTLAAENAYIHTSKTTVKDAVASSAKTQDGRCETTTLVFRPKSGETFEPGTYYIATIPNNYKVCITLIDKDGKYAAKTTSGNINLEGGKVFSLTEGNIEDTINSWKSAHSNNEIEVTYDFSNNDYNLPTTLTKGSKDITDGTYKLSIKADNGLKITTLGDKQCLYLANETKNGGGMSYLQTPAKQWYTIKSAEVTFASAGEKRTEQIHFGKGSSIDCYMSEGKQKVGIGPDNKAKIYSSHVTPYARYYVLFSSSTSTTSACVHDADGYYIEKITYTLSPYSWNGQVWAK